MDVCPSSADEMPLAMVVTSSKRFLTAVQERRRRTLIFEAF
jgi:hypothetical protein